MALYEHNLRTYHVDRASKGYHRLSTPLRIADSYLDSNCKAEDVEFSRKFPKKLASILNKAHKFNKSQLSESVDVTAAKGSEVEVPDIQGR